MKNTIETEIFQNAHELEKFVAAVAAMRQAQRDFFKTKSGFFLDLAKSREKEVDAFLRPKPQADQPKLF